MFFDHLSGAKSCGENTLKHRETAKQVLSALRRAPPRVGGPPPTGKLTPRDAETWAEALGTSHGVSTDLYKRRDQREGVEYSVYGQLSDRERQTGKPMGLAWPGPDPSAVRAGQPWLGEGTWDDATLLAWRAR